MLSVAIQTSFPDTVVGQPSIAVTLVVSNTGTATSPPLVLTLSGTHASDFARITVGDTCTGQSIAPGSCQVRYQFTPAARGLRQATLTVTAGSLTPASSLFQGLGQSPAGLSFASSTLLFGNATLGSQSTTTIQLNNTGDVPTGMPSFTATPTNEFSVTMNTCGAAIQAGTGCSVTVAFSPAVVGARTGTLSATATPGGASQMVSLNGTGTTPGALTITPLSKDFGPVLLGTTSPPFQDFSISNSGTLAVTSLSVSVGGTNPSSFTKSNDTCPATLNGMTSCTVRITFNPQARGALSAFVQAVGTGSSIQANLQGTGQRQATLVPRGNLAFGTYVLSATPPQLTFTLDNTGDLPSGAVTFSSTDANFTIQPGSCTSAVPAGGACSGTVTLNTANPGNFSTTIGITASPGGGGSFTASGTAQTAANLTLAPVSGNSSNYGDVLVNTAASQRFTVQNTGTQPSGPLSLTMTGTDGSLWQLSSGTGDCQANQTLPSLGSCSFNARFFSTTSGAKTGILTASATPGTAPTLTLTANAQTPANLTVVDTAKDFGGAEVAAAGGPTYTWRVTNSGDAPTGALSFTNTNSTEFIVTSNGCTGQVLNRLQSCDIVVVFGPTAGGARTGTLTVSGSPGNSVNLSASGRGQFRLTIVAGFAGGVVSTLDNRLTNCGSSGCSALYDPGTPVTVRATTLTGATTHFGFWVSPSSCAVFGNGRDCALTMSSSLTANARFAANMDSLVFVSSLDYPATLGSATAYDTKCNELAVAANLTTNNTDFVAWVSASGQASIQSRLGGGPGIFRRVDGTPFALNFTNLAAGQVLSPLILDENGKRIFTQAWTGTLPNGTTNANNNCSNWTSTTATTQAGSTYAGPGAWTQSSAPSGCSGTARIFCFQKTAGIVGPQPTVPTGAKIVFVTNSVIPSGNGVTSFDNFCNANKPPFPFDSRSFVALVSTSGVAAANRLVPSANYYRTDGMFVGTGQDLATDPGPQNGIWLSNNGAYLNTGFTWAGSIRANVVGTPSITCNDWFSSTAGNASVGAVTSVGINYFLGSSGNCNQAQRVYCVEQ